MTLPQVVCPGCGMSTWVETEGCALPGCDNYRILVDPPADDTTDTTDAVAMWRVTYNRHGESGWVDFHCEADARQLIRWGETIAGVITDAMHHRIEQRDNWHIAGDGP